MFAGFKNDENADFLTDTSKLECQIFANVSQFSLRI